MKRQVKCYFLFVLCFFVSTLPANDVKDPSTGETFPKEVFFTKGEKRYHLTCTGVATRKKFVVKVYSIASYLENPSKLSLKGEGFKDIVNSNHAKQLTIKWVRNVDRKKIQTAYQKALEQSNSNLEKISLFIAFFENAKKGDEHILRWFPDGVLEVIVNGKSQGTINDNRFAQNVWKIWFGKKSVVNRKKLLSLLNH